MNTSIAAPPRQANPNRAPRAARGRMRFTCLRSALVSRRAPRGPGRRGAAVVEFAFVTPVLFLLVFGMIEYGRMVMVQQVLTNGAREGARLAVLDGTTGAEVKSSVVNYLTSAGISSTTSDITVNPAEPNAAGAGESVTVTVSKSFNEVSWLPSPMFLGGKTLQAIAVMRRETID